MPAVHGCYCRGDMVVRVCKVLQPYRGVGTCASVHNCGFDGEANWLGVVNIHCMQMSL